MYRNLILALISISPALAAGPHHVNYQGYVQNADGTAVNGTISLQLGVWNDAASTSNASLLYLEEHAGVVADNGLVSVPLGSGSVLLGTFDADLFAEDNRWLEIRVNGEALSPRRKFLSVPYALQARQADTLAGLSGAVMHFARDTCPAGWSEYVDARGRAMVGLPANGTVAGLSGSPLADLEVRQHNHSVSTPPGATSTVSSHSHFVSTRITSTDTHSHRWTRWDGSLRDWISWNSSGSEFTITNWSDGMDSAGSGIYPIAASSSATRTIYTDNDAHNHSVSSFTTGNAGAHSHSIAANTVPSSVATTSPTLPYVQLLACIKD